ncbi:NAD-dependent epimerase/dehydratase family protein [Fusobacterium polymorphum]|uniref:dTDP-4-dehydrorhamnose 3,5-epimerase n=1 Tax=Fusobacterium nucleatum subsp. polymorphum TaxID=76857 RepID=A0A2C6BSS6_FUSNP|nr:NAD(P)-dependent oxidoreductase [Fusobacterium polymorphum]PHI06895.1 dTDP-4-dehydrorhamnose 3,5-epimerase [Fusobacterium polymorphum]
MKVLLTGATGFLGKYVIDELKNNSYQVVAFGRNEKIGKALIDKNVEFFKGDIDNLDDLFKASQDCLAIIHAAALSTVWGRWEDFYNVNVLGTKNVIQVCEEKNLKLVFVSSPSIYAGAKDQLDVKEDEAAKENNLNYYIKSKIMAENIIKSSKLNYMIIRPRGLFGVGDTSIIPRLLELNKKIGIPLFVDGKQKVDITCVENVAYALRLALENNQYSREIYNITNDEPIEFKEILTLFFNEMGTEGKYLKWNYNIISSLVSFLEIIYKFFRIKKEPPITKYTLYLMKYSQTLNIDKAKRELGYHPKISILEGVKKYVEHSRKNDRKN